MIPLAVGIDFTQLFQGPILGHAEAQTGPVDSCDAPANHIGFAACKGGGVEGQDSHW